MASAASNNSSSSSNSLPSKIVIAAGTYDGVLAGWEFITKKKKLEVIFASPVHDGSVRSLCLANHHHHHHRRRRPENSDDADDRPGALLSCGYDEMLRMHDFSKRLTSSGEIRTPADFGTPVCSSFAPPQQQPATSTASCSSSSTPNSSSTHCIVGFSGGKLVIYKKKDWVVQHVLAGHEGGVGSLAVHPSGKMFLSGGKSDGKLKLFDLTKGRLAFVTKIRPATTSVQGRTHYDSIVSIVWSPGGDGDAYAFCYGSHITVRDVASGKDLLDVDLPSRVNQICLMRGQEGLFVAAACNDGSLPLLAVHAGKENDKERRAILAIEPVDGPVAGEERFKCIENVDGYYVTTANSAGVVSLMNLEGAVNMIVTESDGATQEEETPVHPESDDEDDDDEDVELAVDIIDSVLLGTGARITSLVAWSSSGEVVDDKTTDQNVEVVEEVKGEEQPNEKAGKELKRKRDGIKEVVVDEDAIEKARDLVSKAKKIQKRKERKKIKKQRAER